MGFSINGIVNGTSKLIGKGLTNAANATEDFFDLENPDGISDQLRANKGGDQLKSEETDGTLAINGKGGNPLTNNIIATDGESPYYADKVQSVKYKDQGEKEVSIGERPYSLFNRYSLVNHRGTPLNPAGSKSENASKHLRKIDQSTLINPTATKIIQMTGDKVAGSENYGYRYSYSDFALTRYFGKIPNNMMVTLRRFAFPAPDDIITPKGPTGDNLPQPDVARAITWMSEATGNQLSDILNFSHGYSWKETEAAVQELNSQKGARSGVVGGLIESDRLLAAAANAAQGSDAYDTAVRKANAGFDAFSNTYPNHVFGPLNVIKNVLVREQGLSFNQEFTLKFEYELRDLGGANPKVLMMDQLSNILALTYNNAPFWGGDVRYIGDGSVSRPLGNIGKLREGDYSGFLKSVVNDLSGKKDGSPFGNALEGIKDFVAEGGVGKTMNNLLGGSLMKLFNSPQGGQAVNSLLTGDPTGQWHVTIGNPLNPIAVIGNLACTDTKVNFEGAMGVQDFPERMVVEVTLKPGRPRDKAEIESMFNSGRGRFYIQPDDGTADINRSQDVSAYGNADVLKSPVDSEVQKIVNG